MRTLADTSVWVDHWRRGSAAFAAALEARDVVTHPFVIGELAIGTIHPRERVLRDLHRLEMARRAEDREVLALVEANRLWGRGIGWVDAHLIASALLDGLVLWTLDRPLAHVAAAAGVPLAE